MKFEFFCDKPQKKTVSLYDHEINSKCEWNTLSNKNAEVKIFDLVMDTVSYDDFINNDGWVNSKMNGKMRLEGKDYIVKDGDVLNFRFNT